MPRFRDFHPSEVNGLECKPLSKLVVPKGFEPLAYRLSTDCSTAELRYHYVVDTYIL
jgi:hypothetical protein